MAARDDIDATEAYAFLRVLAPKLEQLRRRLVASNELLKSADAETARLTAVVETQLALKDFLSGLSNFAGLVEPIDILLALLSEEAAEPGAQIAEAPAPKVPSPKAVAGKRQDPALSQAWLRIGTLSAMDKLINAGMSATGAETFVERVYDNIGLMQHDGTPITTETIKEWFGPAGGSWRRKRTLARKPGATQARGPAAVQEAQERVKEFAQMFKKMAAGTGA